MFQLTHRARQVLWPCQSDLPPERVHTLGERIDLRVLFLERVDLLLLRSNLVILSLGLCREDSDLLLLSPILLCLSLHLGRRFTRRTTAWA